MALQTIAATATGSSSLSTAFAPKTGLSGTLGAVGLAAVGSFPVGGSADPLTPGTFLFMDGVDLIAARRIQDRSLEVTEGLGGVKHLEFTHQHLTGGLHLSVGQRITLRQETVNIFLGTIDRIEEEKAAGDTALFSTVEAVDLNALLERRMVTANEAYVNTLAGDIVKDLVATYASGESLTTNSVQDGATLADFSIDAFTAIAKALRDLSDRTGFVWFVDSAGDLHFEAQTNVPAPFDLGETPSAGVEVPLVGVTVGMSRERYRNRQTVRYGSDLALSVTVNDTAEQAARATLEGGTGIYHDVEDASEIAGADEATALANALLRRFGEIPTSIRFSTRTRGLRPGQTITITLPTHNVSGDFLIDEVTLRDEGAEILRWDATALSGEHLTDNMAFWKKALGEE